MMIAMADIKDAAARSQNMSAIRSKDTKPELFIRKELFRRGYRYRIAPEYIPGHPDLFLRKYNLAVFVHGCFWHRHPGCKYAYIPKSHTEFWSKKFTTNQHRDEEVKDLLNREGIRVIIIWECAIKQVRKKNADPAALLNKIETLICSHTAYSEVSLSEDI